MAKPISSNDADGIAAISSCESLLLALTDLKIISGQAAHDLLVDVIVIHTEAAANSLTPDKHRAVVEIVQRMLVGKDWHQQSP